MLRFLPGMRDNSSWTAKACEPRCNPSRSEMTLTEAAAQMSGKDRRALRGARGDLAQAEQDRNRGAAAAARRNIAKIEKRARGRS